MKYGGSFLDWEVDEAKYVFAVIPVFIVLLPYMTIYNQVGVSNAVSFQLNFLID